MGTLNLGPVKAGLGGLGRLNQIREGKEGTKEGKGPQFKGSKKGREEPFFTKRNQENVKKGAK